MKSLVLSLGRGRDQPSSIGKRSGEGWGGTSGGRGAVRGGVRQDGTERAADGERQGGKRQSVARGRQGGTRAAMWRGTIDRRRVGSSRTRRGRPDKENDWRVADGER